jgi:hypothetical protein
MINHEFNAHFTDKKPFKSISSDSMCYSAGFGQMRAGYACRCVGGGAAVIDGYLVLSALVAWI